MTALADGWPGGELRLGFEDDDVSVRRHMRLREVLPDRVELVPAGGIVEALRAVKDAGEIERIARRRRARRRDLRGRARAGARRAGPSARWRSRSSTRCAGAARPAPSFASIVASAERGALPHAVPPTCAIPAGTLVTLDIGAVLDGYCSDCTRTWATGALPDDLAALVRRSSCARRRRRWTRCGPAPTGREVDAVARDMITAAGHGEHFGHGLGHGVGLDDPRGAAAGPDGRGAGSWRATS